MQEASTRKIYDVHAMFYDATFGRLVRRRIARAISHMPIRPADVILDLGIGTGVSLDYYPTDRGRIIGVDLSSGNGTFINGVQIKQQPLNPGDKIQIGSTTITFHDSAGATKSAPAVKAPVAVAASAGGGKSGQTAKVAVAVTKKITAKVDVVKPPTAAASKPGTQAIAKQGTQSVPKAGTAAGAG